MYNKGFTVELKDPLSYRIKSESPVFLKIGPLLPRIRAKLPELGHPTKIFQIISFPLINF